MARVRAFAALALILNQRRVEKPATKEPNRYFPPKGELFQACSQCPGTTDLYLETQNGQEIVICGDCGGRVLLLTADDGVNWVT